jgi:RNA polymerase sigma factor (sigma-70 family)
MTHDQIDQPSNDGGVPVGDVVEQALNDLLPRLRRVFPIFRDDALVTGILERASRQIRHRQCAGVIDHLPAYAWVTLRHVALSWLRSGAGKMAQHTVSASEALTVSTLTAVESTAEQIERRVLARELLAHLTSRERRLCRWRAAGFTSREIAVMCGMSAGAIDTSLSRMRHRLRRALADRPSTNVTSRPGLRTDRRVPLRVGMRRRSSREPRTRVR